MEIGIFATLQLPHPYLVQRVCNSGAGGGKGPGRPLGRVRGDPASLPHPPAFGGAKEKRPQELQRDTQKSIFTENRLDNTYG